MPRRKRKAPRRDKLYDLLDKRALECITCMRMNHPKRRLDEEDLAIIWNEMSGLVSDFCALVISDEGKRETYLRRP